jgi:hypothetical protein
MTYKPTRRKPGRPPKSQAGPDGEAVTVMSASAEPALAPIAPKPALRRKRADVGGQHLKLNAPSRPGFIRRWVNDEPGRIDFFKSLAYDHVTEPGIKSDSPDSRVRRLVGTTAGGAPKHAYLMETPEEEFQAGIAEKEEARKPFEDAIRRGEDPLGQSVTTKTQSHESSIR